MQLGIERLLQDKKLQAPFKNKNVALVAHPASVTHKGQHTLDALIKSDAINLVSAFGPQHGMRGEKQDNMIETDNYKDPHHGIPVFSLYGEARRPTQPMMDSFDILLIDIQDIGCRIYTYITTLLYLLEACAKEQKPVYILDRPNPAGREIEGTILEPGWESFVGAGQIIMRHGLTLGEMAKWFVKHHKLDVECHVITMKNYNPYDAPGYGWPVNELAWVNPSPNAASVNMTRFYAGSVLLEGTTLSEGRGTSVPLEMVGAADIDITHVLQHMQSIEPEWMQGAIIRPCYFEPTFHKFKGQLCEGFQVHTDYKFYKPERFKPFRLVILFLKAIRTLYPDYVLWRDFAYEYETDRLALDVINGGSAVREWIEDKNASVRDMEKRLTDDEAHWAESISDLYLY